jgi:DNA modification methylase
MTNKIILGDCYELIEQIPDKSIDLIYTDIPYLHQTGGSGTSRIAKNIVEKTKNIEAMSHGINLTILDEFVRVMKKINCFIWCSKLQVIDILKYFVCDCKCNFEILVWAKTNPIPQTNNTFLPDIEYCLYFRESGVPLNHGYELKSKWYLSGTNTADKSIFAHPTIKPLELVKRHICHTTQPNATVLDPFIGSGTTAIAARESGREYIGIEIDPKWHKVATDRLNGIDVQGQTSFLPR